MNYLYYYIFLSLIIIFCLIVSQPTQEGFTPKIRRLYRPYFRKARLLSDKILKKTEGKFHSLLRKVGLY